MARPKRGPSRATKAKVLGARGGLTSGDSGRRGIKSAWSLWEDEQEEGEDVARFDAPVSSIKEEDHD